MIVLAGAQRSAIRCPNLLAEFLRGLSGISPRNLRFEVLSVLAGVALLRPITTYWGWQGGTGLLALRQLLKCEGIRPREEFMWQSRETCSPRKTLASPVE